MLHWLVCCKPAGQSFPDFGVRVSVDFDLKYKIYGVKQGTMGYLIMKEEKNFKKRIYIIIPKFPPPVLSD